MKLNDLIRIISDSHGFDVLDFNNEYPNRKYCLRMKNGKWEFYFAENGEKNEVVKFEKESDACEYALKKIESLNKNG